TIPQVSPLKELAIFVSFYNKSSRTCCQEYFQAKRSVTSMGNLLSMHSLEWRDVKNGVLNFM
ncbi:hypothetical protein SK128_011987, partial [Halocaridina rubra]